MCCIFQVERLKSRPVLAYPLWCALNQDAHSPYRHRQRSLPLKEPEQLYLFEDGIRGCSDSLGRVPAWAYGSCRVMRPVRH